MKKEYAELAEFYDLLHEGKDYAAEAAFFTELIMQHKKSAGNALLDVACGTGNHLRYFKEEFDAEGCDASEEMIALARKKNPDLNFFVADMTSIPTGKKRDVITVLFSSVTYLETEAEIRAMLDRFYETLNPGGVLLIESKFFKDSVKEVTDLTTERSTDSVTIKKTVNSSIEGNVLNAQAEYLIEEQGEPPRQV